MSWNSTLAKTLSNFTDVDIPTDEIVCKVAQAASVDLEPEKIEISHRLNRKKGIKPIIAKFANHKDKTKYYKARIRLKDVTLSSPSSRPTWEQDWRTSVSS